MGLAPMSAVLGFLRTEAAYARVMDRAGRLAADWTVSAMPSVLRRSYVAAAAETLASFGVPARATIEDCRAVQGASCTIALDLSGTDIAADTAIAA
jgi:uncharacterized membrane protein